MTPPHTTKETTMSDDTNDLFADDAKPAKKAEPKTTAKRGPKPVPQTIDNAVNVRDIDWECECGNTNTHDLQQCGKCRKPRYTTA